MIIRSNVARRAVIAAATSVFALVLSGVGPQAGAGASAGPETDVVPSGQITIELVTVIGSGCPAGSAHLNTIDNTEFRLTYDQFFAADGGSARPTDVRRNCQLDILVHIPQGFTYAVSEIEFRGRINIAGGANALLRSNYYFQGSSANHFVDHPFSGPVSGPWHATDTAPITELVYAPCGVDRNLNIDTELRVQSGTSPASRTNFITLRATDADVDTLVHFSWKEC